MAAMEVGDGPSRPGTKRDYPRSGGGGRWPGPAGQPHQQVCRYWQEGRCLKGDQCQWLHPPDQGGAGTTGRPPSTAGGEKTGTKRPGNADAIRGGGYSDGWGRSSRGGGGGGAGRGGGGTDGRRATRDRVCKYWLKGSCQFGDDCKYLHAHSASAEIRLVKQLAGHERAVRAIELMFGSAKLYTAGQDETVRVWDCNTGECTNVVPMGGDVGALLIVANCLLVGLPNEVRLLDLLTGATQSLHCVGLGQVHALAVKDGMLFAGTHDGSVLAWKFNSAANLFEPAASLLGHSGPVITLLVMGVRLYSGSTDKCIKTWDLGTGQCVQTVEAHTNVVMKLMMWESFVLSCSLDGTVRVWAPTPDGLLEPKYTHPEDGGGKEHSRLGTLTMGGTMDSEQKPVLVCSYNNNTTQFYDLPSFSERATIQTRDEVRAIQTGPNGLLFSGEGRGEVKVWCFAHS